MSKARDLGGMVNSSISSTELGYIDGVTSNVQTQLDAKVSKSGGDTITVSSGTTVPLTIQNNGTGNSFVINDETSDTTNFVVDASGSVGIGGAPFGAKLSVSGSSKVRWDVSTSTVQEAVTNAAENAYLAKSSDALSHSFKQSGTERMLIDSSGNIGIGKTPSYTLDVNGTVNATTLSIGGSPLTASGFTLISKNTISAATTTNLDNVFTSTYRNYKLILIGTSTTQDYFNFRFRTSGTTNSNANYQMYLNRWNGTNASQINQTAILSSSGGGLAGMVEMDIFNPQNTNRTQWRQTAQGWQSTAAFDFRNYLGFFDGTTQFDGISFFMGSGTFTGNLYIYGYGE